MTGEGFGSLHSLLYYTAYRRRRAEEARKRRIGPVVASAEAADAAIHRLDSGGLDLR